MSLALLYKILKSEFFSIIGVFFYIFDIISDLSVVIESYDPYKLWPWTYYLFFAIVPSVLINIYLFIIWLKQNPPPSSQNNSSNIEDGNPNVEGNSPNIEDDNPNVEDNSSNIEDGDPNVESSSPPSQSNISKIKDGNLNVESSSKSYSSWLILCIFRLLVGLLWLGPIWHLIEGIIELKRIHEFFDELDKNKNSDQTVNNQEQFEYFESLQRKQNQAYLGVYKAKLFEALFEAIPQVGVQGFMFMQNYGQQLKFMPSEKFMELIDLVLLRSIILSLISVSKNLIGYKYNLQKISDKNNKFHAKYDHKDEDQEREKLFRKVTDAFPNLSKENRKKIFAPLDRQGHKRSYMLKLLKRGPEGKWKYIAEAFRIFWRFCTLSSRFICFWMFVLAYGNTPVIIVAFLASHIIITTIALFSFPDLRFLKGRDEQPFTKFQQMINLLTNIMMQICSPIYLSLWDPQIKPIDKPLHLRNRYIFGYILEFIEDLVLFHFIYVTVLSDQHVRSDTTIFI
uniref:XK-related protein n=1 Tax=Acrobeloides nanus TaxID=290746 RepID=A0A914E4X3_9BILA